MSETALDPMRPVIDPHLHLWDIPAIPEGLQEAQTFLVQDAAVMVRESGHNITHTVFVECQSMYRPDGPAHLRSLGETEFANGMAAMSASGLYGPSAIAHRIVANVDLCLGEAVEPILEAHLDRAGERLCGVRMNTSYSAAGLFGSPADPDAETRLADPRFIRGASALAARILSLDVWCLHPQLPQLIDLASELPDLTVILDHVGTADLRGTFAGRPDEVFSEWRQHLRALAERPNVRVKLSGLSMDIDGPLRARTGETHSAALADAWRDRVETVIETFGPERCMFASNYPADRSAGSYGAIWNAFKRLSAQFSEPEVDRLFRGTAAETYHIDLTS